MTTSAPTVGHASRRWWRVALWLGALGTTAWAVTAILMAGRGFGGPNEGYYVLSYGHWDTTPRTFSMTQYLYGPVFDLLGADLARLRTFRVLTILAAHAAFGIQFTAWLATVREPLFRSATDRWALVLLIAGCGGVVYGWLPATPGYNDISLLGMLVLLACCFAQRRRSTLAVGWALAFGAAATAMVIGKASTLVCVGVLGALVCLSLRSGRAIVGFLACAAAGGAGLLLGLHVFVISLEQSIPPWLDTLEVVSQTGHAPLELAVTYLRSTAVAVALGAFVFALPGLVIGEVTRRTSGIISRWASAVAVAVNLALVALAGGFRGGLEHVGAYQSAIIGLVLTAGVAARSLTDRRELAAVAILLASPFLAALGTDNPLPAVAVGGTAVWLAAMVVAASAPGAGRRARQLAWTAAGGVVLVCVGVAVTGVTHTPQGEPLTGRELTAIGGVPLVGAVVVPADQARTIEAVRTRLRTHIEPAGRPMLAYGALSDVVVELNGVPVGNAWFAYHEDGLQTADLQVACADGSPWTQRLPLVLADRALTPGEQRGLATCGIELERDYRRISLAGIGVDYWAFVPRADDQDGHPDLAGSRP